MSVVLVPRARALPFPLSQRNFDLVVSALAAAGAPEHGLLTTTHYAPSTITQQWGSCLLDCLDELWLVEEFSSQRQQLRATAVVRAPGYVDSFVPEPPSLPAPAVPAPIDLVHRGRVSRRERRRLELERPLVQAPPPDPFARFGPRAERTPLARSPLGPLVLGFAQWAWTSEGITIHSPQMRPLNPPAP